MHTNGIFISTTVNPFLSEEWIWIQVFAHWCVLHTHIASINNIKMQINLEGCPKQSWSFAKHILAKKLLTQFSLFVTENKVWEMMKFKNHPSNKDTAVCFQVRNSELKQGMIQQTRLCRNSMELMHKSLSVKRKKFTTK